VPFAFPIGGCLFHGVESGKGRTLLATSVAVRQWMQKGPAS
jgi:hypothetical protein